MRQNDRRDERPGADASLRPEGRCRRADRMGEALGGTSPRFETGVSRYAWLNDTTCVGTGMRRASNVHVSVFDVG